MDPETPSVTLSSPELDDDHEQTRFASIMNEFDKTMVPFDYLQVSVAPPERSPLQKAFFDSPCKRVIGIVKDNASNEDKLAGKTNKTTNPEIPSQLQPTDFTLEELVEFVKKFDTL